MHPDGLTDLEKEVAITRDCDDAIPPLLCIMELDPSGAAMSGFLDGYLLVRVVIYMRQRYANQVRKYR